MKKILFLVTAGWLLCPMPNRGAETAQARMYCLSLQFQEAATTSSDGFQLTLDLTTLSSGINGELEPFFLTTNYTHSAYFQLYDDLYGFTDRGTSQLMCPTLAPMQKAFRVFLMSRKVSPI